MSASDAARRIAWASLMCLASSSVLAASQDATSAAFVGVHVVPMDGERLLESQTVVVRDGTIAEIGPASDIELPSSVRRIAGDGRYLIPGLADFHTHLRSTDELVSYLAHGVTTIVHLSGPQRRAPDLLDYRREIADGERLGPTLYLSGPILDGAPAIFPNVSLEITSVAAAREAVRGQREASYDFVKIYNNLEPELVRAITEAARKEGLAVVGHIPRRGGREGALKRALDAGQDMIAHGEEVFFTHAHSGVEEMLDRGEVPYREEASVESAVELIRAAGTAVTPNLSFIAMTRAQLDDLPAVLTDPESRFLSPSVRSMWESQSPAHRSELDRFDRRERAKYRFVRRLTLSMQEAGVLLLLGTDASAPGMYPGVSAHLELRELVAAGLSSYDALAAGTRNPGTFIHRHVKGAERFGRVAVGYRADLVLVESDPLEDVTHASRIDGVMVRGRWLDREELDRSRQRVADRNAN